MNNNLPKQIIEYTDGTYGLIIPETDLIFNNRYDLQHLLNHVYKNDYNFSVLEIDPAGKVNPECSELVVRLILYIMMPPNNIEKIIIYFFYLEISQKEQIHILHMINIKKLLQISTLQIDYNRNNVDRLIEIARGPNCFALYILPRMIEKEQLYRYINFITSSSSYINAFSFAIEYFQNATDDDCSFIFNSIYNCKRISSVSFTFIDITCKKKEELFFLWMFIFFKYASHIRVFTINLGSKFDTDSAILTRILNQFYNNTTIRYLKMTNAHLSETALLDILTTHNYALETIEYVSKDPLNKAYVESLLQRNKDNNIRRKARLSRLILKSFEDQYKSKYIIPNNKRPRL